MAIKIIDTCGKNRLKYAPMAKAMAGGAKMNSMFCAMPAMKPASLPSARVA